MNEKEILEYRKRTAERLGLTCFERRNILFVNISGYNEAWVPDKNVNQMLMVWELMRDNGFMDWLTEVFDTWLFDKEDIKLATAKAFMEYDKQQ